ncbi:SAF domain-containing protein [Corynebacterium sp. p3-SID1056]|uniref:SAF domain-containing protein n=1 Tax=Corynebacterium sp. p3-SID1056 TaxID=2916092 RepID=UPI0021A8CFDB|nr:SAF domain-containing protein [Corynebacterium sp. p3-SID1056]MCT2339072.1 SAF domain-containing protein [Corynebacterium sp. p3-SID1056]
MDIATRLRTPGYRRTVLLRRVLAALLIIAALCSTFIRASHTDPVAVVFARDVPAGTRLAAEDVKIVRVPKEVLPANALTDTSLAHAHILAAAAAAGEIVTTTRLVGPDLVSDLVADAPAGEPFTMVPIPLAEPDILPMLHHGARVEIVTEGPRTVATGGRIVTVNEAEGGANNGKDTVLILLRQSQAAVVAAASLSEPLAVVLTPDETSA